MISRVEKGVDAENLKASAQKDSLQRIVVERQFMNKEEKGRVMGFVF